MGEVKDATHGTGADDSTWNALTGDAFINGGTVWTSSSFGVKNPETGAMEPAVLTGDNATRVLLAGTVNFTITVEEARNLMNYDTSMATYSAMLGMLGNNTELPVALTIADTITYTYDNNPSPYLGFLGSLDITILSANNVENSANHGSLNADITIPLSSVISFMSDQHIPFGYTLPERITSNSYTYYSNGYPQTVTDQDNNTKEIFYVE